MIITNLMQLITVYSMAFHIHYLVTRQKCIFQKKIKTVILKQRLLERGAVGSWQGSHPLRDHYTKEFKGLQQSTTKIFPLARKQIESNLYVWTQCGNDFWSPTQNNPWCRHQIQRTSGSVQLPTKDPQQNGFLKATPKKAVTCGLYSSPEDSNCFPPFVMENICPSRTIFLPAVSFTYRETTSFFF